MALICLVLNLDISDLISSTMITSSNGNIFCVTGHLCGEFNGHMIVNSPQTGQWRGTLIFHLICAWINGWVNNGEAGDLRRHRAHYDITVRMIANAWLVWGCCPQIRSSWHVLSYKTWLDTRPVLCQVKFRSSTAWMLHNDDYLLCLLEEFCLLILISLSKSVMRNNTELSKHGGNCSHVELHRSFSVGVFFK